MRFATGLVVAFTAALAAAPAFAADPAPAPADTAAQAPLFSLPPAAATPRLKGLNRDAADFEDVTAPESRSLTDQVKQMLDLGPNMRLTTQSHTDVMPDKDLDRRGKGTYVNLKLNW